MAVVVPDYKELRRRSAENPRETITPCDHRRRHAPAKPSAPVAVCPQPRCPAAYAPRQDSPAGPVTALAGDRSRGFCRPGAWAGNDIGRRDVRRRQGPARRAGGPGALALAGRTVSGSGAEPGHEPVSRSGRRFAGTDQHDARYPRTHRYRDIGDRDRANRDGARSPNEGGRGGAWRADRVSRLPGARSGALHQPGTGTVASSPVAGRGDERVATLSAQSRAACGHCSAWKSWAPRTCPRAAISFAAPNHASVLDPLAVRRGDRLRPSAPNLLGRLDGDGLRQCAFPLRQSPRPGSSNRTGPCGLFEPLPWASPCCGGARTWSGSRRAAARGDGQLQAFRTGISLLLEHRPTPVVPMLISGTYEAMPNRPPASAAAPHSDRDRAAAIHRKNWKDAARARRASSGSPTGFGAPSAR